MKMNLKALTKVKKRWTFCISGIQPIILLRFMEGKVKISLLCVMLNNTI